LGFGLGCWLFFLEKAMVEQAQDVLTTLFRGNFPRWRWLYVSPRHQASPALQSNLEYFAVSGFLITDPVRI